MDFDIQTGQNTNKIVRRFFTVIAIVFLIVLISMTSNIFKTNAPDIINSCVEGKADHAMFVYDFPITRKDMATEILETILNTSQVFVKTSIEECGISYIFSSDKGHHLVCANGEIYEYVKTCASETINDRSKTVMDLLKTNSKD